MSYVEALREAPSNIDGMTIDADPDALDNEGGDDLAYPTPQKPVSKMPAAAQFNILSGWVKADQDHLREFYAEVRFVFAFRAGDQWSADDKALLVGYRRPHIVFNRVLTILKAVAGMEINGRHEIAFVPRGTEDVKPNEVLSAGSKWMAESCDGEDEESQAFESTITCGVGCVEERMSYDDDPAGLYVEEEVDILEMGWDRTAKKKNIKDARRVWRRRRMPIGDAMAMFPGFTAEQLDACWSDNMGGDYPERSIEEKRRRNTENTGTNPYDDLTEVTIVAIEWIEREVYYIVADQATGQKAELSEEQYQRLEQRMKMLGIKLTSARMVRKIFKRAFLGSEGVLLKAAHTAPIKGQFSWKFITGEFDRAKGYWFGLVRVLRDPQMWANKWISQILHILNTTAKGGIMAERNAFDDEREAEESYAQADEITWTANGALSGDKPKIVPKVGQPITEGYVGLLAFAINSFKDVSGINLELLGQQDQNQPGVLEAMRKQAGMTVLATLFDALRNFRKQVGKSRLFFMQNYLSDGRLIRVVSPDLVQAVPLAKDRMVGEYDVVVDDTPTSPNQKEANWAIIQPMLAVFKDQIVANPQLLAMVLEYSPLPSRIVDAFKQLLAQQAQDPEQQQIKAIAMGKEISEIEKNKSVANLNNAKAGNAQSSAVYEVAMAQNLLSDNEREEKRHQVELLKDALAAHQTALEADAKAQELVSKHSIETGKLEIAAHDAATRRISAVSKAKADAAKVGHERIGMMIDHLTARSGAHRDIAAATKDHAIARREDRTPVQPAGGAA